MPAAVRAAADGLHVPLRAAGIDQLPETIPEWPAFADSKEALDALRASGRKIAILSNIDRVLLDRTLRAHDFNVDLAVTAEDVHSYKPELAHWIRLLKMTGIRPDQGLHVTGGYEYDVPPASLLGFRTAYIARYGPPPGTVPGLTIHANLAELVQHVHEEPPSASGRASPSGA